ncbi:MAG: ATP-binding protein [Leptolyngbyaceae cyanobacterium bins.349]|nr:ATP-binding protein [Leptolyngbyaceae cyanobacterium bins.349]
MIQNRFWSYGVAIASVLSILLLLLTLAPFISESAISLLLFLGAVSLSAWYGGWGNGILATGLSVPCASYFFIDSGLNFDLSLSDAITILLFTLQGTVISILVGSYDLKRKQTEVELRQKNAILDVINQSAPTPIFVKDRQGRIIYANPATLEVLGKSAEAVIGCRDGDLYPFPEDAAKVMANDQRIMAAGQMEVVEESPDGVRTFLAMKAPYRNELGEVIGLIGISNDITERVQLERDRERLLQQEKAARTAAEQANRIKDEFLAVLSHELRSPLNPILGWIQLLQKGKLSPDRQQQAFATIERNAKLQTQLIEDLLDISRIMRGKLTLNVAPVNLETVIIAAIETVYLAAEAKAIELSFAVSQDAASQDTTESNERGAGEYSPLQVMGDATRLQQVVWNLLSNAVKFTAAGGRVEVKLESDECSSLSSASANSTQNSKLQTPNSPSYAQIKIIDTGKGIGPEFLPYIFEHFRQEDGATTRSFGGLGLGLAIARQLVELHQGTITAESDGEGQGATFIVRLPRFDQQAITDGPTLDRLAAQPEPSISLTGYRILVVDDEADSRDFVEFVLQQAGAEVQTVASGQEAIALLPAFAPQLLCSDIGMPKMDGYMLMRQVRALPPGQGGNVLAIALTAYVGELDQQRALSVGFHQHLSKPIEPEQLVRKVLTLISQSVP